MEGKIRVVSEHDTGSCGLSAIVLMQMPSAWQVKTSCWAVLENMPVWPDHCIMQRHCPSSQAQNRVLTAETIQVGRQKGLAPVFGKHLEKNFAYAPNTRVEKSGLCCMRSL